MYLDTPPNGEMLKEITVALGCSVHDIMRTGESIYKELNIADSAQDEHILIERILENPILLERPIVTHAGKAVIGRPPEAVLSLFR